MAGPAVLRWAQTIPEALPKPPNDGTPKVFSEKIRSLADQISTLTLLETADLSELLKVSEIIIDSTLWYMCCV